MSGMSSSPWSSSATSSPLSSSFIGSCVRVPLLVRNALTAMHDPNRADAVAAVGELTGLKALQELYRVMQNDPQGRLILQEKPIVSKETIPYDSLLEKGAMMQKHLLESDPLLQEEVTFGHAYGAFLVSHGYDPDERDPVHHLDDPELAYVMLRYRQCHDFWHALTSLPPTVAGELGLKWLELFQTGLPLPALSSTIGSLRLDWHNQRVVWNIYLPWAYKVAQQMKFGSLMTVYYEHEFDTPLVELQQRLRITPAPQNVERPSKYNMDETTTTTASTST